MIDAAKKWIGYLEHRTNDLIGVYQSNVGKGYYTIFSYIVSQNYRWLNYNGVPWCAVFIHAVCIEAYGKRKARELLGLPHPGSRVLARRMKRKGWFKGLDYIPAAGDLIFLQNGDGRISHCGIVEWSDGQEVTSVEGNTVDPSGHFAPDQGGAVAIRIRKINDPAIMGYGKIGEELV